MDKLQFGFKPIDIDVEIDTDADPVAAHFDDDIDCDDDSKYDDDDDDDVIIQMNNVTVGDHGQRGKGKDVKLVKLKSVC